MLLTVAAPLARRIIVVTLVHQAIRNGKISEKEASAQESEDPQAGVDLARGSISVNSAVCETSDLTKLLGWPGYRVYRHEIDEKRKTLQLRVRRKRGNRKLICSGCGRRLEKAHDSSEREVRDLPCMEFNTAVSSRSSGCAAPIVE
jgi:hypothetical protein